MSKFNKICKDISSLKIQGAENIAKAALEALRYKNDKPAVKKLISLRPTEPKLLNALEYAEKYGINNALEYFEKAGERIAYYGNSAIRNNSIIYTHCHSSTVMKIIAEAKRHKKQIVVNNTETRPKFQGRRTASELANLKIPNNLFVDSAMRLAIKNANIALLGCDAITPAKIYNKIGSELVAETCERYSVPLYICTISWAFDPRSIKGKETPIEYRDKKEVWENPPRNTNIVNPAFEKINPRLVSGIICEHGILPFRKFLKKVKRQ